MAGIIRNDNDDYDRRWVCCTLQGLQLKLSDLQSVRDSLKSLSTQLTDSATSDELDELIVCHNSTSAEVEASIQRLRDVLKSWDDVRAEMERCAASLSDARQLLSGDVPEHQENLQHEADELQVTLAASHTHIRLTAFFPGQPG